jgi:hypothetical protein
VIDLNPPSGFLLWLGFDRGPRLVDHYLARWPMLMALATAMRSPALHQTMAGGWAAEPKSPLAGVWPRVSSSVMPSRSDDMSRRTGDRRFTGTSGALVTAGQTCRIRTVQRFFGRPITAVPVHSANYGDQIADPGAGPSFPTRPAI